MKSIPDIFLKSRYRGAAKSCGGARPPAAAAPRRCGILKKKEKEKTNLDIEENFRHRRIVFLNWSQSSAPAPTKSQKKKKTLEKQKSNRPHSLITV